MAPATGRATSPWVLGAVYGVVFATAMTITFALLWADGGGPAWPPALVGGSVGGLVFGGLMGPLAARRLRQHQGVVETLSRDERRRAARAAWRGPVPTDPVVRSTATRMLAQNREEMARIRWWVVGGFGAFLVLAVGLALTSGTGWWGPAAVFATLLALWLAWSGYLRRRETRLLAADGR
jgi:Flp pilus assembly protein TadB